MQVTQEMSSEEVRFSFWHLLRLPLPTFTLSTSGR